MSVRRNPPNATVVWRRDAVIQKRGKATLLDDRSYNFTFTSRSPIIIVLVVTDLQLLQDFVVHFLLCLLASFSLLLTVFVDCCKQINFS